MGWEWRHTRNFGYFWKKAVNWDSDLGEASPAGVYGMRGSLVGVSCSWSSSCSSRQWEPIPSRGLGSSGPPVEQPGRMRKEVLLKTEKLGVNLLQSVQSPSHLSPRPFRNPFATISNKVWEVYFSKEVCSFVIIVDFVSACICVWLYMYYGHATLETEELRTQKMI